MYLVDTQKPLVFSSAQTPTPSKMKKKRNMNEHYENEQRGAAVLGFGPRWQYH